MKFSHIYRILLLFVVVYSQHFAQYIYGQERTDQYIRKINSSDGLSHNIVFDIIQDNLGFIWVATQDGLNRYDGHEFNTFRFNPENPESISGNYIKSLFVDEKNRIWASSRYGLNLYHPLNERFSRISLPDNRELDITQISRASDGGLWLSNYAGGFHLYHPERNEFTDYNSLNTPLVSSFVLTIIEDSYKNVWIGTENYGAQVFTNNNGKLTPLEELNEKLQKIDVSKIEVLFEDVNSNIWIGSKEGIVFYNRSINEFYHIQKNNKPYGLSDDIILDINQDNQGNILIGTQEGGLDILSQNQLKANNPTGFKFERILAGSEDHNLSYRSVQTIFEDRDKNLWLGTFGNGINVIPFNQPKFKLIKHNPENPSSINFDKVWGICEDNDGNLWIGTDGMGLNKFNFSTRKASQYVNNAKKTSLSDNAILCALNDSKGRLWFGTYSGGLNLFNPENESFIHYTSENTDNQIPVNDIRCLYESKDGKIWLGTNGGGLVSLDAKEKEFENIVPQSGNLGAFDIRAIAEDNEGGLWLGTYGVGLFYYHPRTNVVKHFKFDRINPGNLNCNIIYSLLYDKESNLLWIGGSQNGGLNRMNLNDFTFKIFNEHEGLKNNNIHAMSKDQQGKIWVSTNSGISVFNPATEKFQNYSKLDGVQEKEFSNGSVLVSKKHNIICFGGSGGLNYFTPRNLSHSSKSTNLVLTHVTIFSKTASKKEDNTVDEIQKSLLHTDELVLNHKQNNFTVGFSGLSFSNPEKINYQYMLEGSDKEWTNLDARRNVSFRNLKSGDYVFKVRASNEDGIWPQTFRELSIKMLPPPWKSWWAILIYILLVSGIILWLYTYNLKEAKIRHNLVLEKRLRVQEHELHEERIRFFTNISHELRTPLMLLINPLEDLVAKESPNSKKGKIFGTMYRSANKLLNLINTLLEFRKTETGKLRLQASQLNLTEFLEEISLAFNGLANKKGIELIFEKEHDEFLVWFDPEKLEMIINNLLSNAVKNTGEGKKIVVSVSKNGSIDNSSMNTVSIKVIDEGAGIPPDQLNRIFDRFYQVKGGNNSSGTGIGLALTKRLVELHKGSITVQSKINKGTAFEISLPLGNSHLSNDDIANDREQYELTGATESSKEQDEIVTGVLDKISSLSDEKQKILLIEDNPEIRTYLRDLLQDKFNIEEAQDGEEGLRIARKSQPDLILSDIMMPKMNGVDLCKTIKGEFQTSHIPVILITANLTHNIHIDSLEVGADAYLTKPFKPDVLITRIFNLLKSRIKLREYYLKQVQGNFTSDQNRLNKDEEFLMKINKLIHENMGNSDFSVSELHSQLGLSRTVFYNKVKSLTNESPIDLIRKIRLKKAGELLLSGNFKVYEVMFQVGFSDEKHFRQLFKNQFGMTPTEYISSENH